jgi:hypothetical protein
MVTTSQIIKGEITYALEDFYQDLKDLIFQVDTLDEKTKEKAFQSVFLFIMLSAEEKTVETMMDIFNQSKEQILMGREAFKEQIDICRAIHMKKFLEVFEQYLPTTDLAIQMVNFWIKDFLKGHIKEEENVAA